jgi:hypothetical protein
MQRFQKLKPARSRPAENRPTKLPQVVYGFTHRIPRRSARAHQEGESGLEVEAHHIALHAIGAPNLGILRRDMNLISNTMSKTKNPAELGEASYNMEGGCRLWLIKRLRPD